MDAEVGQIMDLLASQGNSNDTMVLFTGDNGMPFPRAKGTLYEAGIHVPMIAWMPGKIAANSVKREMIAHVDFASTWLNAAGIEQSKKMQGRSFLPLLLNQPYQARTEVFCERNWHDTFDPMRSIRTERHKFIFNAAPHFPYRPPSDLEGSPTWQAMLARRRSETPLHLRQLFSPTRPVIQLFDLAEDPLELNNLVESPAHNNTRQDLERRLSNWMNDTYDFLPAGLGAANDPLSRSWPFTL
jgi:arylsulfatase A-like enzyme